MEVETSKQFSLKYFENERLPTIDDNEILIKVNYCSLSKEFNVNVLEGKYNLFTKHDSIPGYEVTGNIELVGSQVSKFKKNHKVISILPLDSLYGGFGEHCISKAWNTVLLTEKINLKNITGAYPFGILNTSNFHKNN